ncbi:RING-H2 finger protein atl5 [Phtheirospermum japonicum]|uniref:RING-H2 finger protein atl5 n=1 Tax=Phtheirospermum japonicum TaxID=374723 RepID=A0A830AXH2_9LAMI|nr:RING-H2 finger protein atl5 [Phtheirospermum japonicum]
MKTKLLFSCFDKIILVFFLKVLPELLRLIILAVCVLWKHYKHLSSNYKYTSTINKKSAKFAYSKRANANIDKCSICLSEFAEGEEGRELVDCKHAFHRDCLEKWLQGYTATCPLCRSSVVPAVILAEYHEMQVELENDGVEKELALILLNALRGRSCNGYF